jgi:hypothetical protein
MMLHNRTYACCKIRVWSRLRILSGGFIAIVHGIRSPQTSSLFAGNGILSAIGLLVIALMHAVEFYGIHTKTLFAWKLGWGILAAMFLQFLVIGGSSALQLPGTDYPWVAFAAVVVGGSVDAAYWGFWWKRQKDYFTTQSPTTKKPRTKELAVVLCLVALVFACVALIAGPVAKYHKLGHQAVKQFHEQLASGQYVEIYDAADETLRDITSKADFVNLLQSVHERLGDVESLNPGWQGIAFHGGQRMTISEYFDTKFAHGNGTEWFVWQAHDNRLTLGLYQIKSSVLTSR